jgi:hypothetical protein
MYLQSAGVSDAKCTRLSWVQHPVRSIKPESAAAGKCCRRKPTVDWIFEIGFDNLNQRRFLAETRNSKPEYPLSILVAVIRLLRHPRLVLD